MSLFLSWYHFLWSFFGALFFGFPSRRIFVLGVTGTKGKSTVLELINAILEAAGRKTALLSSIRIKIDKQSRKNYLGNTMPGRAFIQSFLRQAVNGGCEYALVEATSQGVLQHRHRFIKWDAALFTNLAPEHIEAHKGFENYRKAKGDFFKHVAGQKNSGQKLIFINQNDANSRYFAEAAKGGKVILYSKPEIHNSLFIIPNSLIGDFNQENIAAAIVFAQSQGISDEIIKKAVESFPGVPGRMEIIQTEPFTVIVDYAHTPDSLEKVYQAIHNSLFIIPNSRMICVLGSAGGGRDKWKRPKMGEIAGKYCEEIILTNEDPYDENPSQILSQIKSGISNFLRQSRESSTKSGQFPISKVFEILDRKGAIKKAISLAKKGDVVIITGKGCEPWLHTKNGKKIPWDEKKIVEELIKEIKRLTN